MDPDPILNTGITRMTQRKQGIWHGWWAKSTEFPTWPEALQQVVDKMARQYGAVTDSDFGAPYNAGDVVRWWSRRYKQYFPAHILGRNAKGGYHILVGGHMPPEAQFRPRPWEWLTGGAEINDVGPERFEAFHIAHKIITGTSNWAGKFRYTFSDGTVKRITVRRAMKAEFRKEWKREGAWPFAASHTSVRRPQSPLEPPVALRDATAHRQQAVAEALKNEHNWVEAHREGLSPELYFYGYTLQPFSDQGREPRVVAFQRQLYLCAISEAFDCDLNVFYDSQGEGGCAMYTGLTPDNKARVDEEVRRQLTDLFNDMANKMKMICFDIKPNNTVINYTSVDDITVKLIDWDQDNCKKFRLQTWAKEYAGILMQMIMAMFFFGWHNNNIFDNHLRTILHEGQSVIRQARIKMALKKLFCTAAPDFARQAQWYFVGGPHAPNPLSGASVITQMVAAAAARAPGAATPNILPPPDAIDTLDLETPMNPDACSTLFNSIYDRCIFKNAAEYAIRNADARAATAAINAVIIPPEPPADGQPRDLHVFEQGGGRRRKTKRRRRRRKRRRTRQKKRRRRKTRRYRGKR